jgi:hypothetical protein
MESRRGQREPSSEEESSEPQIIRKVILFFIKGHHK